MKTNKLLKNRLKKGLSAMEIQHPIMQTLSTHRKIFIAIAILAVFMAFISSMYFVDHPQDVMPNLVASILEISALAFFILIVTAFKITTGAEELRINNICFPDICDGLIIPIFAHSKNVLIRFDSGEYYSTPKFLEAFWRFSRIDKENFFLSEAGALDLPKLTLLDFKFSKKNKIVELKLGHASFYDIFYTHYSPDLVISSVSSADKINNKTLRSILSGRIKPRYLELVENINRNCNDAEQNLSLSSCLPNPLGLSGIVLIKSGGEYYVILRKRGGDDIAAKNLIEWSFAGTFESLDWLGVDNIEFNDLVSTEFDDEILAYSEVMKSIKMKNYIIGLVINELYMYQPEVFVVLRTDLDMSILEKVKVELKINAKDNIFIEKLENIPDIFKGRKTKNLFKPGLKLLTDAIKNHDFL